MFEIEKITKMLIIYNIATDQAKPTYIMWSIVIFIIFLPILSSQSKINCSLSRFLPVSLSLLLTIIKALVKSDSFYFNSHDGPKNWEQNSLPANSVVCVSRVGPPMFTDGFRGGKLSHCFSIFLFTSRKMSDLNF